MQPHKLNLKSGISQNSSQSCQIFQQLFKENLSQRPFKNRQIWSHCAEEYKLKCPDKYNTQCLIRQLAIYSKHFKISQFGCSWRLQLPTLLALRNDNWREVIFNKQRQSSVRVVTMTTVNNNSNRYLVYLGSIRQVRIQLERHERGLIGTLLSIIKEPILHTLVLNVLIGFAKNFQPIRVQHNYAEKISLQERVRYLMLLTNSHNLTM